MICNWRTFSHSDSPLLLKSGTTWTSPFQLQGSVRQGFMVTSWSQDLFAVTQSVSQAVQHVGNVVLLASGPLRKPAADVTQWLQLVLLSPAIRPPPALPFPFAAEPCAWHSHCSRRAVATVYLPRSCTHWALSWSGAPHAHKAEVVAYLPGWRRGHHEHRNRKVIGAFYPNKQVFHTGG